jgi:flagellar protein FliT
MPTQGRPGDTKRNGGPVPDQPRKGGCRVAAPAPFERTRMNDGDQKQVMEYYETIAQITRRMLRAAQEQDWDALADAESCCARLIDDLRLMAPAAKSLAPEESRRKHEIMCRLLADDAQIRRLTQPGLLQFERLLAGDGHSGRCRAAHP